MMSKILKILVPAVGILVAVTAGMRTVQHTYRLKQWHAGGEIHSSIDIRPDSSLVFMDVNESDFAGSPIPEAGDSLISINGEHATFRALLNETSLKPAGNEFNIHYMNNAGDTLQTTVVTIPAPETVFWIVLTLFFLRVLIWIAFLVTGFWAFVKQPDSGAVRALALFCFCLLYTSPSPRDS